MMSVVYKPRYARDCIFYIINTTTAKHNVRAPYPNGMSVTEYTILFFFFISLCYIHFDAYVNECRVCDYMTYTQTSIIVRLYFVLHICKPAHERTTTYTLLWNNRQNIPSHLLLSIQNALRVFVLRSPLLLH